MLATLLLAFALEAQSPSPPPPDTPPPAVASEAEYAVGSGDVLDIGVIGNPDLTRTTTVQTSGVIALPLLGEVKVTGLTPVEIQRKLTTLLERDFLVNPQVEVKVREYQSQFVIVLGDVNSPGRKAIRGRTRLVDMLIEAGGFKPDSSGELVITRTEGTFDGGQDALRFKLGSDAMSPQDRVNLEIPLRNGDLINVLPKSDVTVEGEVARPGRYSIDGRSTVSQVIQQAGGLTRFASNDVKLRRVDAKSGKVEILDVDLKDIRNGKKPDVTLEANDTISVPRRRF